MKTLRLIALVIASGLMAACSSTALKEQPALLPDSLPQYRDVAVQWWHILGEEHAKKVFGRLAPTVFDDQIYTPLANGEIVVLASNGQEVARRSVATVITAPLAVSEDLIVTVSNAGTVIALTQQLDEVWQYQLNALALAAPVIDNDRVYVQSIDGRITAIEKRTGRLLWSFRDAEPGLTITGTAQPVLFNTASGTLLLTGLANGKFVALNVATGAQQWEYRIARASGKTDVSRLVDVDSGVIVVDNLVIIAGYQGDLVVIDPSNGSVVAAREFSTYRPMAFVNGALIGVDDKSHVIALNPNGLTELWRVTHFEYRQLSQPVIVGENVLVSDVFGFLHAIDLQSGQWMGSRHIDWRGSNSYPVAFKDGVLLQGYSTRLKYLIIQ